MTTTTFAQTGTQQSWVVPAGVTSVEIELARAAEIATAVEASGKPALVGLVDQDNGLVVLTATDGSGVSFAVYPRRTPVERRMATLVDGAWQGSATVADLDAVGEQLKGGA